MCEGVGEDSRHGAWHVDIHVEMCIFLLEYVLMCGHGIACALRWGAALVGDFLYFALLILSWEIFSGTGGKSGDEIVPRISEEKGQIWLCSVLYKF